MKLQQNLCQCKSSFSADCSVKSSLLMFDRAGQERPLSPKKGHIFIISNSEPGSGPATKIQLNFACASTPVKTVSLRRFSLLAQRRRAECLYLVVASSLEASQSDLSKLLPHFSNIFVFPIKGIKLVCALKAEVKVKPNLWRLLTNFGDGVLLRTLLLATLTRDEFLVIEKNADYVRCLTKKEYTT